MATPSGWPWPFDQADQVDHARLRVTRPVPAFGLERGDLLFLPLEAFEDADRQDQPTEVLIVRQGRAWALQLRPVDLLPPAPASETCMSSWNDQRGGPHGEGAARGDRG